VCAVGAAVLGHRGEHVGGCQQPCAPWKVSRPGSAMVAAAVQTLVVRRGERRERREQWRRGQDALGPVQM